MKLVIGITGSIAAYKSLDLARQLRRLGIEVRFILTSAAQQFVTRLSCQTLSNNDVYCDQFALTRRIEHVHMNDWADMMVIAPATANIIGKIAAGIADDLLSTAVCSFSKPILIVPAMDTHMWENTIVQDNVRKLRDHGYNFLGPLSGSLASGKVGKGRFPHNELIIKKIMTVNNGYRTLAGKRIIVTGGRTEEDIDPVRVLTNRSSGRMATEIMMAAFCREADIYGIFGEASVLPVELPVEKVRTSEQMLKILRSKFEWCDCLIMAAAVGDYKPLKTLVKKIHKPMVDFKMTKTVNILSSLRKEKSKFLVGFSLEDNDPIAQARKKLREKDLDMIVMNDSKALGTDKLSARIMLKNNRIISYKKVTKWQLANKILDRVLLGMR